MAWWQLRSSGYGYWGFGMVKTQPGFFLREPRSFQRGRCEKNLQKTLSEMGRENEQTLLRGGELGPPGTRKSARRQEIQTRVTTSCHLCQQNGTGKQEQSVLAGRGSKEPSHCLKECRLVLCPWRREDPRELRTELPCCRQSCWCGFRTIRTDLGAENSRGPSRRKFWRLRPNTSKGLSTGGLMVS